MKRTTYIIFGVLLGGLALMSGIVFYLSLYTTEWEDSYLKIKGERQTVVLPSCKVMKLAQTSEKMVVNSRHGKVSTCRFVSFGNVPLAVAPTDSLQGSLSFAGDMASFVSVASAGDTATVSFDFSEEKMEGRFRDIQWLRIQTEKIQLSVPAGVEMVWVDMEGLKAEFRNFRRDTFAIRVADQASVKDCRVASLSARGRNLRFNTGEVRDLYLDLDGISSWSVNVDSFRVDTEHLTGGRRHDNFLQKGECRRVIWTPKNEKASLDIQLSEATEIEIVGQGNK